MSLIKGGDRLCERFSSGDFLARLSVSKIRDERKRLTGSYNDPKLGSAYIIRQFKRKSEIELMRSTYGRKFIQISIYMDESHRREYLKKKIVEHVSSPANDTEIEKQAIELIRIDGNEDSAFGQEVSDVFHRGDVFVDCQRKANVESSLRRFIRALFGHNGISPTKMEYGMYAAAGAALRSIDLSRQVGAAIFSEQGEIITLGCNEVPKAFGGTYWEGESYEPHRDFEEGLDANQLRKLIVVKDFIDRLDKEGLLLSKYRAKNKSNALFDQIVKSDNFKESKIMDIIEFGRMIHAEMSAITDAARTGKRLKDSILFSTTFPCHMCAKHIVSSGIKRLVFLEPYPKSYAQKLHYDSITFEESEAHEKVLFEPFLGISPRRYRDIFEKGKRKDNKGKSMDWCEGRPTPRIEDRSSSYIENEDENGIPVGLSHRKRKKPRAAPSRKIA